MLKMVPSISKKIFVIMSVILFTFSMITFTAPGKIYGDTTEGDFTYTVVGSNATITGYTGAGGDVTIPSTLGGYPVTSIGDSAFYECTGLTSIIIPSSVTSIGDSAFSRCWALTSITIPNSVTSIGASVFYGCTSLTSATIQSSVTSIGSSAFTEPSSSAILTIYGYAGSTAETYVTNYNKSRVVFSTLAAPVETAAGTASAPRSLTPDEWVALNPNMGQLLDHYGAASTGFLNMLYDNSMQRISDDSGFNYWDTQLNNGVFGANQVVEHFIFSDEIGAKVAAMSNAEFINFLYKTLFARTPDTEGYNNWLNYMNSGVSKEEILKGFLNSEEWINICNMFNVTP